MSPSSDIKPNFFILGAPKCGTTALAHYLAEHPEIRFSTPKEPKFFHTDFRRDHRLAETVDDYMACFGENPDRYPVVGEATVWYLYSRVAVPRILEFNPQARFLVMARNPVDLAYSLHAQLLYGGDEDEASFETAWGLQEERAAGRRLPTYCRDPKVLQYRDVARVGEQLERLHGHVDSGRVHVVLFDDFRRDTAQVYREVLEFLGISGYEKHDFEVVNANRHVRFPAVASAFYFLSAVKRRLGIHRSLGVWKRVSPLFSRRKARVELAPELRRRLRDEFASDIAKLSCLTGRDLSHW